MKNRLMQTALTAINLLLFLAPVTQIAAQAKPESGYVSANGVKYYYEIYGTRQNAKQENKPLLLLHGGLGSIEMFGSNLQTLSENRTVIAVDLQGHGRTELGNRPFRYTDMVTTWR